MEQKPTPEFERRGFLMKSALLLTGLGVAGTASEAIAQTTAEGKAQGAALNAVIAEAVKTGDIKGALQAKGAALPPAAKATLEKLTPEDLKQMQGLEAKLGALKGELAADNTGGNGM